MPRATSRAPRARAAPIARVAFVALVTAISGCVPREETTPLGYVVAPSAPASDGGSATDPDAAPGYSKPAPTTDARK